MKKAMLNKIFKQSTILENEPLSKHTSYAVGGEAKFFVNVCSEQELSDALLFLEELGERCFVLGAGSNVLFSDAGYDGAVLCLKGLSGMTLHGNSITAGAGVGLAQLAQKAMKNALSGAEFLSGIPGSVGGAVRMNAGCYGGEVKDVCSSVRVLRRGAIYTYSAPSLTFSYRKCHFMQEGDVVLSAEFTLREGERGAIGARMRELNSLRRIKQPLNYPSCGSVFKRPENGYAAELIERAGLKGYRIGNAQVSEKHSGFIVNLGGAKCTDILKLIDYIQKEVYNRFKIKLEPEVVVVQ